MFHLASVVICSHAALSHCIVRMSCPFLTYFPLQLVSALSGTQWACMYVKAAFRNSPIWPPHKAFCVVEWHSSFFMDHVFPFGLATVQGAQGCVSDVAVDVLEA